MGARLRAGNGGQAGTPDRPLRIAYHASHRPVHYVTALVRCHMLTAMEWQKAMSAPCSFRRAADSCMDCQVTVDCPTQHAKAEILVARWRAVNGQYTPWTIVDCSLLPAGQICCHVDCMAQLTDNSQLAWRHRPHLP